VRKMIMIVAMLASMATAFAQGESPQQLFEAGRYDEALQRVTERRQGASDPIDTYLAAQSFLKLERSDDAKNEFARLVQQGDRAWQLIGNSSVALVNHDENGALEQARAAVMEAPDHFFAHYQFGLVAAAREDWTTAANEFERATQIDPSFAYAQYYAGLAYSKLRRIDRTAAHFELFLKLAPRAPERPAVEATVRTLRGR
jgi:tetratricopeptide (TPR) repeat protein